VKHSLNIQVAIKSYLLRSSIIQLIADEYGNLTLLDQFESKEQITDVLNNLTGCLILEEEYLKLLPSDFLFPKFLDIILLCVNKSQIVKNKYFKEFILYTDTKPEILKKLESVIKPIGEEVSSDNALSDREKEVVKLVAKGFINKEIADILNISIHTVITHRKNITQKLGIKTISGLSIYAFLNGIITAQES
jgi:DNA-binding CsgD family transcriptional regulator